MINLANHEPKKLGKAIEQLTALPEEASAIDAEEQMALGGESDGSQPTGYADWKWTPSWENEAAVND